MKKLLSSIIALLTLIGCSQRNGNLPRIAIAGLAIESSTFSPALTHEEAFNARKGEDVFKMFAHSDLYIMPSVSEPFGISPLEAMQTGVPVIISKQSGVSEILKHAIKIDFWDIDKMANAIYAILNYPALSKTIIENGWEEANNLRWDESAQQVHEVYQTVLSKT